MASNSSQKKKRIKKMIIPVLKISIILFIVVTGVLSGIFFAYIDTASEVSAEQIKSKIIDTKTVFYDDSNSEFETVYGTENREWVNSNEIPKYLKQAFISIEDERFYKHNGIDFRRIASAIVNRIKPGGVHHGASTITQQLVRNLTGETQVKMKRKIQEQWRAIQLEKQLSKEQILELYLNIVPLNNGIYGVQAGANAYFNKDVSQLTLAECASLAAITNLPMYYDPSINPNNNKKRQENILFKMHDLGYIDKGTYELAVKEELSIQKGVIEKVSNHTYFTDQVINDVVRDLQLKKGYTQGDAEKLVYNGGLKIYTTASSDIQDAMDGYFTNLNNFVKVNGDSQPESAMVILDPNNGQVKGLIGGIGSKKGKRTFNRATQSFRQPGSSIKPLSVYSPAIEAGKITPNTIVADSPIDIDGWKPNNYDFKFMGNITIRTAVRKSRNVAAVRVLEMTGLKDAYNFLKNLGISSLQIGDRDYAPLSLGALSKGASPLEMAAAYAPISNGGLYIKPYTYLKVIDSEGRILLDNTSVDSRAIMKEQTAFIMTDLLKGVVTNGTGTLARLNNMPAAGKTGTSSEWKDKWFVGFTPYYVGAVWYGYDTPAKLPSSTWNTALLSWKSVMEKVHEKLPYKDFKTPEGIFKEVEICTISGKKATTLCYKDIDGSKVRTETFVIGTEPEHECNVHEKIRICKSSGQLATLYCPTKDIELRSYVPNVSKNVPTQSCEVHSPRKREEPSDEASDDENKVLIPINLLDLETDSSQNNQSND